MLVGQGALARQDGEAILALAAQAPFEHTWPAPQVAAQSAAQKPS